jgi:hypothetical protein
LELPHTRRRVNLTAVSLRRFTGRLDTGDWKDELDSRALTPAWWLRDVDGGRKFTWYGDNNKLESIRLQNYVILLFVCDRKAGNFRVEIANLGYVLGIQDCGC